MADNNNSSATSTAATPEKELTPEEYKQKADELESKLDRSEGRPKTEIPIAKWYEERDLDLTVAAIDKKGLGMISRRPVADNTVIFTCPPYACVPYETRKKEVCAYCFTDWSAPPSQPPQVVLNNNANKNKATPPEYDPPKPPTTTSSDNTTKTSTENNNKNSNTNGDNNDKMDAEPTSTPSPSQNSSSSTSSSSSSDQTNKKEEENGTGSNNKTTSSSKQNKEMICCEGCAELWYCSRECMELDREEHRQYECAALANFDIAWAKDYYQYCDDLITDIRLLIRTANRKKWEQDQGHPELFELDYKYLIANQACYPDDVLQSLRAVVQFANYVLPDTAEVPEDEFLDIYCKHRVNMFGLWGQGGECLGYGVYPKASFLNHSCWPNTTFSKNNTLKTPHMDFITVFPIDSAGEEVCISYIDIAPTLGPRRNVLLDKYFFHCTCERCVWQEDNPNEPDPYQTYWAPPSEEDGEQDETLAADVAAPSTGSNSNNYGPVTTDVSALN